MKSREWLMMTPQEKFNRRQDVISMLDDIGPELEQFNRGAAEYAFNAAGRLSYVNDRLAGVLARQESERLRHSS